MIGLRGALRRAWVLHRPLMLLGLAMGGLALALAVIAVPRQSAALSDLQTELQRLRDRSTDQAAGVQAPTADGGTNFVGGLPGPEAVARVLGDISLARSKYSLQLGEVVSRPGESALGPWRRHEFEVPLVGSFALTRKHLSELLANHATIALEAIEVQRDSPSDPVVRTRLRLTLYYRPS
jgi:hypothetical protein